MRHKFGEEPEPPTRPTFQPTIWFWLWLLSVVTAAIAAIHGYTLWWWYVGIMLIIDLIIYGFARNDTR